MSSEVYLGGKLPYPLSSLTFQSLIMAKDRQHKPYRCPSTWIHHHLQNACSLKAQAQVSLTPGSGFPFSPTPCFFFFNILLFYKFECFACVHHEFDLVSKEV